MKRLMKKATLLMLMMALVMSVTTSVLADSNDTDQEVVNEKLGDPIVVYGATLSAEQKEEVKKLLKVSDTQTVREFSVDGSDISKYIDGDPNSRMFSSAKIVRQEKGNGLTIRIVTPENITKVTSEMYANALLTAGVEDATVDVASPIPVTGHSALSGIYKAYDEEGETLDKERMELANEELGVATDLAEKEGMTQEKVSELLTEIKKAIAEQNPATKEDIEKIIQEQLSKLEISLNEADRQMLANLFDKMRELNIDFDKVKGQLEDLTSTIKDKAKELGLDEGFWEKVMNFFKELFNKIASWF
ncbi:DUF1002 domain-containing protein [Ornithinibacillus sp. 4-3]|uniref:DUF1002 domain-containing protein n=1 Tax=Ornithinibacillus sp. 4-3 TaxID=3231488 RepID=A0AB39HQF0_9BACI